MKSLNTDGLEVVHSNGSTKSTRPQSRPFTPALVVPGDHTPDMVVQWQLKDGNFYNYRYGLWTNLAEMDLAFLRTTKLEQEGQKKPNGGTFYNKAVRRMLLNKVQL